MKRVVKKELKEGFKDLFEDERSSFRKMWDNSIWGIQSFYDSVLQLPYQIKKLVQYFPIIWKDRDFDHSWLFILMKFKIDRMIPIFDNGHLCNCERNAKELRVISVLLGRLIADDYYEYYDTQMTKKYGKLKMLVGDKSGELHIERSFPGYDKKAERKDFHRAMKKSDEIKQQDLDLLFRMLRRKVLCYWD